MRPVGDGATRRIAAVHRHEISDALLQLLTRRDLPAPAVAAAGWLLSQMLPGPCAASSSNGVLPFFPISFVALYCFQLFFF